MREPLETAELVAFTRIVDAKSLSRAARELRAPRPTISRRLARLEARLGVRLLRRTTRSLALTDAGEALYRQARLVLDALAAAEASVRRPDDAMAGELRISAPPILDEAFYDLVARFTKRHASVRVQVHVSAREVDLRREGYDVAIRAGTAISPGLVARNLFRTKLVLVASPAYLAEAGTPRTTKDLRAHRCLMGFGGGDLPQTHWQIDGRSVHVQGAFFSNDMPLLCGAAARAMGIALVPHLFAAPYLATSALVPVLPHASLGRGTIAAVWLDRELLDPRVRAFVDAIAKWQPLGLRERDSR
jgi:DNA-binding transcriptional LysR family regulator